MDAGPRELADMPNHRWTLAAAWLLLCVLSSGIWAASNTVLRAGARYSIDVWETDNGLPQNSVIAMTQTRDGYLWVGTLNGLARFDGIRFTVFDENNTPGLNSSRIVKLFEDSQTNFWIGTETAGTVLVKDGRLINPPELALGGAERRLAAVCEDSEGAVWLYNRNGELYRYWNGRFAPVFMGQFGPSNCRAVIAESGGPVWVGTDQRQSAIGTGRSELRADRLDFLLASRRGGYWRLANGVVQKWTTREKTNLLERDFGSYRWTNAPVSAACEDREGNLLVGTLGAGVFWFDSEGKATCLSTNEGLSHNLVLSLHVDREGTLWVGTDGGGLNRVKQQVFDVLEETRGLTVQSSCEGGQGELWIGFNTIGPNASGAGLWKEGVLQRFGSDQGLMNSSVRAVFADRFRRVWAGTLGGLFQWQDGHFQRVTGGRAIHAAVWAIHEDRRGRLWLGTQGGLVRWDEGGEKVFTTRDGLSSDSIRAIADDAEGNLWVGMEGGGLNRMRDGQFTSYHKQDGLPSEKVTSLYPDDEGVLWIGTSSGLARLRGDKWTRYTTREGLVSNSVGYIMEDGQGNLWIGSNAGLMRAPKKALNDFANGMTTFIPCRAYGKRDGLPIAECTSGSQPGACHARDGTLWFPTIKGLVSVNPARLNPNTNPPPVVIESVLIDGQSINAASVRAVWPQAVTVPASKERVEIHYTSLNLGAPDLARFQYRLEGHETDWIEAGETRVARYSKLPPGRYRFQVTACNEDGIWNETGDAVAFIVEPPFWRTWWFLSAAAACLLGTIMAVVHYLSTQRLHRQLESLRQQEALQKDRARIARDMHDQVGASLTQLSLLGELVESDKNAPEEVEVHARQISQTAQETTRALDEIVWTVNPSNDTLDGLITYVCKYAQEYLALAGLRYRLDVPAVLPVAPISPEVRHNMFLASKEAVTNVVRHAQASSVSVRLHLEPGRFTLEIEDNGRGLGGLDEQGGRNGLRNMRKRMEDVGGLFSIAPAPEGGTVVRLTAPVGNH
jgi:ligand-binding sensor domain-containing protein/signal transduction histidine kinase